MNLQKSATIIASVCAIFLAIVKFIVGLTSGSVAVLSSAIDSLLDCVISGLNFLALKKSSQGSSKEYNFGLSKIEALMGFFEGLVISGIGVYIFYVSVLKIHNQESVEKLDLGIFVMIFAMIVTLCLVFFLNYVAKKTKSLIIQADSLHYKIDFLTNALTLLALIIIVFTNYHFIDGLFGIAISLYTIFSAFKIIKESSKILLDVAIEKEKVEIIKEIINANKEIKSFHHLKTRKSPDMFYVSVHLVFKPTISLLKAHEISDEIEDAIRDYFKDDFWSIHIHLDPYDDSEEERNKNEISSHSARI
ncbi:cation diffusion facilitator family transporter [Campylobacter sp. RM16704]|uniref:cation diffusion facilitator family transporter n=1 Tax=Campylobacter sp. RM16704 TaxID=1500960 RepID=UPI00057F567C|nr:cation diffusion facilitator family transporter [Campylobacter sp. RM16704]AJC86333.1 cation diffusion facilitator family transporter [Campylobacter sp. RM16704]